jgi:hypothetical protein
MDAYKIGERDVRYIGRIIIALFFVAVLIGYFIGKAFAGDFGLCCDSYSSYSASSSSLESSHSLGNSGPVTIQPPVGVPSHAYTSPNGTITIGWIAELYLWEVNLCEHGLFLIRNRENC